MKKIFQLTSLLVLLGAVVFSCTKTELSTDQFETAVVALKAYGPQPVVRGGVLRFVGSNLDKVATVTIPGVDPIAPEVITSGEHSEIRVTVPKDGPEPGFPILTLADGSTITGKTQITYSEPITIESFSPAEVLPGQSVTITGDYLNLIHEAIFANKIVLSENLFTEHTRYKIVVAVPETAQTGKIGLGTVDETATEDENLLASLNIVETETELVVTTAKGTLAAITYKAGQTVTISGTNLNLVKGLLLEGATMGPDEFTASATSLTFPLYASVADGEVVMVMASGVEVSAGAISTVVPVVSGVTPAPVKNGDVVTLVGSDLDLVTGFDFPHSAGAEFAFADGKITATVTEKAQEGDIVLSLANGKTVTAELTLVKPTVTGFSANPASAGSDVTIEGTDLDLVAAVTFAGGIKVDVPEGATATAITLAVPTAAETGKLVLNLKNGSDLEAIELAVDKPAGAYIGDFPKEQYKKGDMFVVDLINADHLTGVQIDGTDVNYLLTGDKLYVVIPDFAKADSQITLVSDNGSVTYTMNIDPGDKVEVTIWTGPSGHTGDYAANQELGGEDDWVNAGLQEGDEIRIYFTPDDPTDWSIQVFDGHWGGMGYVTPNGTQWNNENDPEAIERGYVSFRARGDAFKALTTKAWWGSALILQGKNMVFSKISYVHYYPQETTVWTGPSSHTGDYAANQELGGEDDWVNAGLADGDEVRIYFTPDDPTDWSVQVFDGHWGGMSYVTPNGVQWNNENDPEAPERGYVSFVATGDAFTAMTTKAWWGSALILQGKNMVFNKLTFVHIP